MRISLGFLLLFLPAATLVAASRTEATHSFASTLPSAAVRRVIIELPSSETTVVATASNELRIEGTARREYSGDDEKASMQRVVDAVSVTLKMRGRSAYVERAFRGSPGFFERNSVKLRFTLYVPENMPVEVRQKSANVSFRGNLGDVDADVAVGNIHLEMAKKQVAELTARSRIGEVTTDLPDRTVVKQGVFAGATQFLNDGGKSVVRLKVNVGQIDVSLR